MTVLFCKNSINKVLPWLTNNGIWSKIIGKEEKIMQIFESCKTAQ